MTSHELYSRRQDVKEDLKLRVKEMQESGQVSRLSTADQRAIDRFLKGEVRAPVGFASHLSTSSTTEERALELATSVLGCLSLISRCTANMIVLPPRPAFA